MKKIWFLKALGISLFLLTTLFFTADKVLAVTTDTYIEFDNISVPATDAKYLRWEIKAKSAYDVVLYLIDDDGNKFQITFSTADATNAYSVSSASYINNIGTSYYNTSPSTETYTANLGTLISNFTVLGGTHGFTAGDPQAKVDKLRIYGDDITVYSIGIANNSSFSSPKWEIDNSDFSGWTSVAGFKNDDGDLSDTTTIDFQSSYLHVTKTVIDPASTYVYPYGYYPTTATGSGTTTGYPYGYYPTTSGYYPTTGYPTTGYPTTGYPTTGYPTTGTPTIYTDPRTGQQYIVAGTTPTTGYPTSGYPTVYVDPRTGQQYISSGTTPTTSAQYPYATTSAQYPYGTTLSAQYPYGTNTSAQYPYGTTSAQYPYATTSAQYPYGTTSAQYPYGTTSAPYGATAAGYGQQPLTSYGSTPQYPYATAAGYGQQPLTGYGQQYLGGYGTGLGMNTGLGLGMNAGLGLGGINPSLGLAGGMMPAMYPPMGLPIPPAGLGMGMGFDPFGFGLGLTGLGAFDPLSIAALAKGYPGLGPLGLGGFGLF